MKHIKLLIMLIVTCMIVPQLSYAQKKRSQSKHKASAAKVSEPRKQSASIENSDNMTAEQLWQKFCALVNDNKFAESTKYLKKAAEKKHLEAMYLLGKTYLDSNFPVPKTGETNIDIELDISKFGIEKNEKLGSEYIKYAAEHGHGMAMIEYGRYYLLLLEQDKEAFKWFSKASVEGYGKDANDWANYYLGLCYLRGWGCTKNENLGLKLFSEIYEAHDARENKVVASLGKYYVSVDEYAKAAPWLHKAAGYGNEDAMFILSYMYKNGEGVPQDLKLAFDFAKRATDKKHAWAAFSLASFYESGIVVEKNISLALQYYESALKMEEPKLLEEQVEHIKQKINELKR